MLGGLWQVLVIALLIPAVILRDTSLLLVTILLLLTGGLGRIWAKYLFAGVEYSRRLSSKRVFFGDSVTLTLQVTNRKILPLPWFRIEEEVPAEVEFQEPTMPGVSPNRRMLVTGLSLQWYNRVTRRYTAQCHRRGSFQFGPARLETGDMFGLFRRMQEVEPVEHLLVYPRIVPLEQLGIPSKELFGDIRVRRHLFEDPVRVVGTRDYISGDPMKRVHWKTSARVGKLQSRVFEPTTSVDAALFLDTRTIAPPFWGFVEELLELAVITAASIASYAQQRDIRTGLYVNQTSRYNDRMVQIPPSSHTDQLPHILEALAQVHPQELTPIANVVQRQGRNLPWNTTIVAITAVPVPPLLATLTQYRRAGRRVALVLIGGGDQALSHGIPVYHVSEKTSWADLEQVRLEGGLP